MSARVSVCFLSSRKEVDPFKRRLLQANLECLHYQLLQAEYHCSKEMLAVYSAQRSLFIFSSQHAVAAIPTDVSLDNWRCAAVGKRTAESLLRAGVQSVEYIGSGSMQSLLAVLEKAYRNGESSRPVYFRGERVSAELEGIASEKVEQCIVYSMKPRMLSRSEAEQICDFVRGERAYFAVASCAVIEQFHQQVREILDSEHWRLVKATPFLVFSDRIGDHVEKLGFRVAERFQAQSFEDFAERINHSLAGNQGMQKRRLHPREEAFAQALLSIKGGQAQRLLHARAAQLVLPEIENRRVLEAGCGSGVFSRKILNAGPALLMAADINQRSLDALSSHGNEALKLQLLDLTQMLPFAESSFDVAICNSVLMHLEPEESRLAIAEFARVVGSSGSVFIAVLHEDFARSQYTLAKEYGVDAFRVPANSSSGDIIEYYPDPEHYTESFQQAGLACREEVVSGVFEDAQSGMQRLPIWRLFYTPVETAA